MTSPTPPYTSPIILKYASGPIQIKEVEFDPEDPEFKKEVEYLKSQGYKTDYFQNLQKTAHDHQRKIIQDELERTSKKEPEKKTVEKRRCEIL